MKGKCLCIRSVSGVIKASPDVTKHPNICIRTYRETHLYCMPEMAWMYGESCETDDESMTGGINVGGGARSPNQISSVHQQFKTVHVQLALDCQCNRTNAIGRTNRIEREIEKRGRSVETQHRTFGYHEVHQGKEKVVSERECYGSDGKGGQRINERMKLTT